MHPGQIPTTMICQIWPPSRCPMCVCVCVCVYGPRLSICRAITGQLVSVPNNPISAGACSTFGILHATKLLPKVGRDQGRLILYLQQSL